MFKLKEGWTKARVMKQVKKYNDGTKALLGKGDVCVYQTISGNRCAIGCFIPDNHPGLKSKRSATGLLIDYPDLKEFMPFDDTLSLMQFQCSHDQESVEGVYDSIQRFLDESVK